MCVFDIVQCILKVRWYWPALCFIINCINFNVDEIQQCKFITMIRAFQVNVLVFCGDFFRVFVIFKIDDGIYLRDGTENRNILVG